MKISNEPSNCMGIWTGDIYCQVVRKTSSLNALRASWWYMVHCVINWQVIVLKDLSLPLDKVLLTDTNFVMYIKARSEKVRLSRYCEDGNEHSYLLFY